MSKKIRIAFNHLDFYFYFGLTSSCPLVLHSWLILMQICITKKNSIYYRTTLGGGKDNSNSPINVLYSKKKQKKVFFLFSFIFWVFLYCLLKIMQIDLRLLSIFLFIKIKFNIFLRRVFFSSKYIIHYSHGPIRISVNNKCDNIPFCKWWFLSYMRQLESYMLLIHKNWR